jgi:hypothetical protein
MKKMYQKPQAEIVIVRCKDKLLDWLDDVWGSTQGFDHTEAKEMQIRFEEEQEMHEELGKIFSEDNLVDPWK